MGNPPTAPPTAAAMGHAPCAVHSSPASATPRTMADNADMPTSVTVMTALGLSPLRQVVAAGALHMGLRRVQGMAGVFPADGQGAEHSAQTPTPSTPAPGSQFGCTVLYGRYFVRWKMRSHDCAVSNLVAHFLCIFQRSEAMTGLKPISCDRLSAASSERSLTNSHHCVSFSVRIDHRLQFARVSLLPNTALTMPSLESVSTTALHHSLPFYTDARRALLSGCILPCVGRGQFTSSWRGHDATVEKGYLRFQPSTSGFTALSRTNLAETTKYIQV